MVQINPTPREGDAHAGQRKPWRAGYIGHLTLLANKLLQVAATRPKVGPSAGQLPLLYCQR